MIPKDTNLTHASSMIASPLGEYNISGKIEHAKNSSMNVIGGSVAGVVSSIVIGFFAFPLFAHMNISLVAISASLAVIGGIIGYNQSSEKNNALKNIHVALAVTLGGCAILLTIASIQNAVINKLIFTKTIVYICCSNATIYLANILNTIYLFNYFNSNLPKFKNPLIKKTVMESVKEMEEAIESMKIEVSEFSENYDKVAEKDKEIKKRVDFLARTRQEFTNEIKEIVTNYDKITDKVELLLNEIESDLMQKEKAEEAREEAERIAELEREERERYSEECIEKFEESQRKLKKAVQIGRNLHAKNQALIKENNMLKSKLGVV